MDALHVFGAADVKQALVRFHGKRAEQYFIDHMVDILSGEPAKIRDTNDGISRVMSRVLNAGTYIALWGNVNTMLKQAVSQYATALRRRDGDPSVTSDLFRILRNPAQWRRDLAELKQSKGYRARYGAGGIMDEVARVVSGEGGKSLAERIAAAGMTPIQFGDKVGGILVAVGAYQRLRDKYLLDHPDATYEEAAEWAAVEAMHQNESTQQSSQTAYKPNYARRGSVGHRLLMMFSSATNLQASWEATSLSEWRAAADPYGDRNFAEAMFVGNWESAEARRRFGRYVRAFIVNHFTVPLLMEVMTRAFSALLGYPPPELEDELKSIAMLVLLGQFGRLAIVGTAFDIGLNQIFGNGMRSSAPSVFNTFDKIARYSFAAVYDAFSDPDEAIEDLVKLIKSTNAPTRHITSAVENWSK